MVVSLIPPFCTLQAGWDEFFRETGKIRIAHESFRRKYDAVGPSVLRNFFRLKYTSSD
jgi:hypothetical protein